MDIQRHSWTSVTSKTTTVYRFWRVVMSHCMAASSLLSWVLLGCCMNMCWTEITSFSDLHHGSGVWRRSNYRGWLEDKLWCVRCEQSLGQADGDHRPHLLLPLRILCWHAGHRWRGQGLPQPPQVGMGLRWEEVGAGAMVEIV